MIKGAAEKDRDDALAAGAADTTLSMVAGPARWAADGAVVGSDAAGGSMPGLITAALAGGCRALVAESLRDGDEGELTELLPLLLELCLTYDPPPRPLPEGFADAEGDDLLAAYRRAGSWPEGIRAAIETGFAELDDSRPAEAGEEERARWRETALRLLEEGVETHAPWMPEAWPVAIVAFGEAMIDQQRRTGGRLASVAPVATYVALCPFLGAPAAGAVASARPWRDRVRTTRRSGNRARLIGSMRELLAERGFEGVDIPAVAHRAGLSALAFRDCFEDERDCAVSCVAELLTEFTARFERAFLVPGGFAERLEAGIAELIGLAREGSGLARTMFIDAPDLGPRTMRLRESAARRVGGLLASGFENGPLPAEVAATAVLGGIRRLWANRLATDRVRELEGAAPEIANWALSYRRDAILAPARGRERGAPARLVSAEAADAVPVGPTAERIARAAAIITVTGGHAELSVARLCAAGDVDEDGFRRHFADERDAFRAGYRLLTADAAAAVRARLDEHPDARDGIQAAAIELVERIAAEPGMRAIAFGDNSRIVWARLGEEALVRRAVRSMVERAARDGRPRPSDLVVEALSGAVWTAITRELTRGGARELRRAAPIIETLVIAPLFGRAAAARIA